MMNDITRRDALVLGVSAAALAATGTSARAEIKVVDVPAPALPIEKGATLRMLRPVRFVPADEEVFRANAAAFTAKTGVEVKVDFVGFDETDRSQHAQGRALFDRQRRRRYVGGLDGGGGLGRCAGRGQRGGGNAQHKRIATGNVFLQDLLPFSCSRR